MAVLCCLKNQSKIYDLLITWVKDTKRLNFSSKLKKDNSFSFFDVKICREKDKFTTSVFRKDTFSGVYTNFSSFVALGNKFDLVSTKTLHENSYPTKFVDKCTANFTNTIFAQKPVFTTVPKLELRIVLPL